MPVKAMPAAVAAAPPVTVDLTQADDGEEEEDDSFFVCFGRIRHNIVGIQYYTGTVQTNEMVQLVREPENPYDRFAVRVDNVRGERVGHLKREVVYHMSPLVDQKKLRIEGVMPGGGNKYVMPVVIYCFGPPDAEPEFQQALRRAGLHLEKVDSDSVAGGMPEEVGSVRLSPSEMEDSLDRLFADMLKGGARELMDAAPQVVSPLYPHQQQALAWMVRRELSGDLPPFWEPRKGRANGPLSYVNSLTNFCSATRPKPLLGGILADDMGLGKTLELIALMATNRAGVPLPPFRLEEVEEPQGARAPKRRKTAKGAAAAVAASAAAAAVDAAAAAVAAAAAAVAEVQPSPHPQPSTSTAAASTSAAAGGLPPPLAAAKVKLTKAQAKLAELAAAESPAPAVPVAGGPKGTLVVCPMSVMSNWTTQIEAHTDGSFKVYQYHGADRNRSVAFLADHDVVVTTYPTLTQELSRDKTGLLAVNWLRVVLDEAHTVKNTGTQQFRAVEKLKTTYRWAVSGTPIQNKLGDLQALLRWLKLEPLQDKALFARTIDRPIRNNDTRGLTRLQVLLAAVAMRRTKDLVVNGKPIVSLPPRTVHIATVTLTPDDRLKYDRWELEGRRIITQHLNAATLLSNYSNVLEIILRLRQIACDGTLCPLDNPTSSSLAGPSAAPAAPPTPELLQRLLVVLQSGGEECPICLNELQLPCITRCSHAFCRGCIEKVLVLDKPSCPMCRHHLTPADIFDAPAEDPLPEGAEASPAAAAASQGGGRARSGKVAALMQQLHASSKAGIKSVVFSQFTGMLNLIGVALKEEGLPYVRLDGSTTARHRASAVEQFGSDAPGSPVVFLISLRAGGVGMNLVAASHVHLMDPWWNPAVEEQAMDRVHRLGQTRPVEVFRYVAEGTIEERMLELQARKRELSTAAFERRNQQEQRQMRIDDIKLLMSL